MRTISWIVSILLDSMERSFRNTRELLISSQTHWVSRNSKQGLLADLLDDAELDDDVRESIETSARFLYGLIHARYIVTSRGLGKMVSTATIHLSD